MARLRTIQRQRVDTVYGSLLQPYNAPTKAWQIYMDAYGTFALERRPFNRDGTLGVATTVTLPMGMDTVFTIPERYQESQYTVAQFGPDGMLTSRHNPIILKVGDTLQLTTSLTMA